MKTIANYCSFIEFLTQVIYHKALQIIENFFPDGDEVKKISLDLLFHFLFESFILFQLDEEIAPKAGEANFEFSAAESAVPGAGFQFWI